jgi:hypothetical protein
MKDIVNSLDVHPECPAFGGTTPGGKATFDRTVLRVEVEADELILDLVGREAIDDGLPAAFTSRQCVTPGLVVMSPARAALRDRRRCGTTTKLAALATTRADWERPRK